MASSTGRFPNFFGAVFIAWQWKRPIVSLTAVFWMSCNVPLGGALRDILKTAVRPLLKRFDRRRKTMWRLLLFWGAGGMADWKYTLYRQRSRFVRETVWSYITKTYTVFTGSHYDTWKDIMRLPQIKIYPYRYITLPSQGMLCLPPNTRYPPINKFSGVYIRVIEMLFVL